MDLSETTRLITEDHGIGSVIYFILGADQKQILSSFLLLTLVKAKQVQVFLLATRPKRALFFTMQ